MFEYLPPVCGLCIFVRFFFFYFKVRACDCLLRIHSLPTLNRGGVWGHALCEWQWQWCHLTWRRWWGAKRNEWEKCLWTEVWKLNSIGGDDKCFRLWEIVFRGLNGECWIIARHSGNNGFDYKECFQGDCFVVCWKWGQNCWTLGWISRL